jgi:uncharacterized protein (DUF983 family)
MNFLSKGSRLYSILKLKCPHCQEGDLFISKNPYRLKTFDKMPERCVVCNEDFRRESGFYWGAMMISHANTTLLAVVVHLVMYYFYGWAPLPFLIVFLTLLLLLFTVVFRTSRAAWLSFFVKYDPKRKSKDGLRQ